MYNENPQFSFADLIEGIAKKAGLIVQKRNPALVIVPFNMGDGRKQTVWIKALGKDQKGNLLASFSSPALKMPAGQMLSQQVANDLLRENAALAYGNWAIEKSEDGDYLVVRATRQVAGLNAQEFEAVVRALSWSADAMEKKLGVDAF